jgi:hypothetical protein
MLSREPGWLEPISPWSRNLALARYGGENEPPENSQQLPPAIGVSLRSFGKQWPLARTVYPLLVSYSRSLADNLCDRVRLKANLESVA